MSIPFVEGTVQASGDRASSKADAATPAGGKAPRRRVMPVLPAWALRVAAGVATLVLLGIGVRAWLGPGEPVLPTLALTELLTAMDAGRVEALTVRPGLDIRGTWSGAAEDAEAQFAVTYTQSTVDALVERAEAAGVAVTLAPVPERRSLEGLFSLFIQVLLLAVIGWFLLRHFRGGEGQRELGSGSVSDVTFGDVAGTQGAAEELREVVDFLRAPQRFAALGARVPKGALLVGPPGTGKTLLARAVAGEAGVPFYSISGSEVTGFLVGMGAHRIKSLFRRARKKGGVIFIDEIDALGGKRGRNRSHNEDDRTLNQLLVEMDGFSPLDGVVVIAATNRPDDLDEALKRPGRFDRVITVAAPTASGREAILRLHVERRGIPLHASVDLARLGRLTTGASGADLANLLNEAAIAAVRGGSAGWSGRTWSRPATACCWGRSAPASARWTRSAAPSPITRRGTRWWACSARRRTGCTRSPSRPAGRRWAWRSSRPTTTGCCTGAATWTG
jgi:cell division protease FtsH